MVLEFRYFFFVFLGWGFVRYWFGVVVSSGEILVLFESGLWVFDDSEFVDICFDRFFGV